MSKFILGIIFAGTLIARPTAAEHPMLERLIACGAERVFVIDVANPAQMLWSWEASDSSSIPEGFRSKFRSTDDCKPYEGNLILITSSSRGVALIDRKTKQCLFLAEVPNAHSACLLPGNQIAVAASTSGDSVHFYSQDDDRKPAVAIQQIPLMGAHGTVWDAAGKRLWALGTDELLQIKPTDDSGSSATWIVTQRYALPSSGGHDLSPVHDGAHLFVTTDKQVLRFNTAEGTFEIAEEFTEPQKIKSVDLHPVTKRIVFHQALPSEWWSHTIRFHDAPPITMPDERLYKIRWDVPAKRP